MRLFSQWKKFTSVLMLTAFASQVTLAANITPEMGLLEKAISLQGKNLNAEEAQAALNAALVEYKATATADQGGERMKAAILEMGLLSEGDLNVLTQQAQVELGKNSTVTKDQAVQMVKALADKVPTGSAYSPMQTRAIRMFIAAFVVGFVVSLAGYPVIAADFAAIGIFAAFVSRF